MTPSHQTRVVNNLYSTPGIDRHVQYVWGPRYIDDIICHREDNDLDGEFIGVGDEIWYHLTDVQFSTVAITDDLG